MSKRITSCALALFLVLALVPQGFQAVNTGTEGYEAPEAGQVKTVWVENMVHTPQVYRQPRVQTPKTGFAPMAEQLPSGPFAVNDTRPFYNLQYDKYGNENTDPITAKLIAQGEHVNIWVVDDASWHSVTKTAHSGICHNNDITPAVAQGLAIHFDKIYVRMTTDFGAHANTKITTGYGNVMEIGDLGNDEKVNFLLYDIKGDGAVVNPEEKAQPYTAGYFAPSDFYTDYEDENDVTVVCNSLDMMHIDIGEGQGYKALLEESQTAKDDTYYIMYSTMAHEFQHMLFYMYFGVYAGYGNEYTWLNEALAELAGTYYAEEGYAVYSQGSFFVAAQNIYANYGWVTYPYGDMFNFNGSMKSYGMGKLFSMLMYKEYGGANFTKTIYTKMKTDYPPASNNAGLKANESKIATAGHDKTVGDLLKEATGVGDGEQGTLRDLYFQFMENFAADGGKINGVSGVKFFDDPNPLKKVMPWNLWAVRPALGAKDPPVESVIIDNGVVYTGTPETPGIEYYDLRKPEYTPYPTIAPGGEISLRGYPETANPAASHEKFYKLNSGGAVNTLLTISVQLDSNEDTKYYVVVPNDKVTTNSGNRYSTGANGADVYPLNKSGTNAIDTKGNDAYLYVVTFYQNVEKNLFGLGPTVVYTWSEPTPVITPPEPEEYVYSIEYYVGGFNPEQKMDDDTVYVLTSVKTTSERLTPGDVKTDTENSNWLNAGKPTNDGKKYGVALVSYPTLSSTPDKNVVKVLYMEQIPQ